MSSRWRGNHKAEQARRDRALDRPELRQPSEPRKAAAGVTSFPVKQSDPETDRLVQEALARRRQ